MEKQKTIFKSAYNHDTDDIGFIPTGDGYENEYGYEINKTGQKVLVIKGQTNRYAQIQEQLESTLIENVLGAVAAGDNSVLRPQGIYADLSEQPKNLIEARQMIHNLEETWFGLTPEIRKKFDNDIEKFVGESGNSAWFEKLGIFTEAPKTETKTEEKAEPKTEEKAEPKGE